MVTAPEGVAPVLVTASPRRNSPPATAGLSWAVAMASDAGVPTVVVVAVVVLGEVAGAAVVAGGSFAAVVALAVPPVLPGADVADTVVVGALVLAAAVVTVVGERVTVVPVPVPAPSPGASAVTAGAVDAVPASSPPPRRAWPVVETRR